MAASIWFTAAGTAISVGSTRQRSNRTAIDGQPAATYGPRPLRPRALLSSPIFWKRSMLLTDLVAPNAIVPALKVNSKKLILQELAVRAAELCAHHES